MGRDTTAAFNAALDAPVAAVGYLLKMVLQAGSPDVTLRLCDIGTEVYDGQTWDASDFTVEGYKLMMDGLGLGEVTVEIQNLDGAMAALLLPYPVYDAPVTLYQIARSLGSPGDAPLIAQMVVNGVEIRLDKVVLRLLPLASRYTFAPYKRVDASFGLASAVPIGTRIPWGSEVYVIEAFNG